MESRGHGLAQRPAPGVRLPLGAGRLAQGAGPWPATAIYAGRRHVQIRAQVVGTAPPSSRAHHARVRAAVRPAGVGGLRTKYVGHQQHVAADLLVSVRTVSEPTMT